MSVKLNGYAGQINVIKSLDLGTITGKTISFVGAFSVDKKTEILVTPIEISVK